jgi:hypothetical protein
MNLYKEQPSYNKERSKEYKRTHFKCEKDDSWLRVEVPVGAVDQQPAQVAAH